MSLSKKETVIVKVKENLMKPKNRNVAGSQVQNLQAQSWSVHSSSPSLAGFLWCPIDTDIDDTGIDTGIGIGLGIDIDI